MAGLAGSRLDLRLCLGYLCSHAISRVPMRYTLYTRNSIRSYDQVFFKFTVRVIEIVWIIRILLSPFCTRKTYFTFFRLFFGRSIHLITCSERIKKSNPHSKSSQQILKANPQSESLCVTSRSKFAHWIRIKPYIPRK